MILSKASSGKLVKHAAASSSSGSLVVPSTGVPSEMAAQGFAHFMNFMGWMHGQNPEAMGSRPDINLTLRPNKRCLNLLSQVLSSCANLP